MFNGCSRYVSLVHMEFKDEYDMYRCTLDVQRMSRYVILNPKLKEKSNKTALFFEDCVSVFGYEAMVERFLEVEVTGLDQDGQLIKVDASGWLACILQHECDHLDGILYVDKMEKGTFGTVLNHKLPLAKGWPQQGVR
ncbi:peptide deformylase 1A, chloroplastic-like protein [Tanacetum coccineum]